MPLFSTGWRPYTHALVMADAMQVGALVAQPA
jgi:hypothetical protein